MEGRLDLRAGQAFQHASHHAQVHPGLTGSRQKLIIFAHAPVAAYPSERAFYDPAPRQHLEPRCPGGWFLLLLPPASTSSWLLHNLQSPAEGLPHPGLERTQIGAIGPDEFQARQPGLEVQQEPLGALAVLETDGMNDYFVHQAQGINQQMAFAAGELLGPVVPMRAAAPGRFDRLASDDRGTGRRLSPDLPPQPFAPRGVNLLPRAVQAPFAEIGRDRGPGAVITRQQAPLAAAAQHMEDAVEDHTHVDGAWVPTRLGGR